MTTHDDSFPGRRETIQDRVAELLVNRGERLRERFGEEPYNADRLTPEQRRAAFALIREDPLYLAERHTHYAKVDQLPEGHLHRGYLEDLARNEAEYQDHKQEKQRSIDLTFPELSEGPEIPAGG